MSYKSMYQIAKHLNCLGLKNIDLNEFLSYLKTLSGFKNVELKEIDNGFLFSIVIFGSPANFLYSNEMKQEKMTAERLRTAVVVFLESALSSMDIEDMKGDPTKNPHFV